MVAPVVSARRITIIPRVYISSCNTRLNSVANEVVVEKDVIAGIPEEDSIVVV